MYKKTILICLSVVAISCAISSRAVFASTLAQQTDHSVYKDGSGAGWIVQSFTGISGTLKGVRVRLSKPVSGDNDLQIWRCTSSACSTFNILYVPCDPGDFSNWSTQCTNSNTNHHTVGTGEAEYGWDFTYNYQSTGGGGGSSNGISLSAGSYYAIYLHSGTTTRFYGSSDANSYTNGSCSGYWSCGSVSDLYFMLSDSYVPPPPAQSAILSFLPAYSVTPIGTPTTISGTYSVGQDIGSSTPNLLISLLDTDNGDYKEFNFGVLSTPGTYTYSTTTTLLDGRYHMSILFDNSPNVYVATSSEFIVNKTVTPISSLSLYFPATSTPITITTGLSDCDSMLTASGIGCAVGTVFKNVLYLLFVPDTYTRLRFQEQYNDLKYKAPLGLHLSRVKGYYRL